MPLQLQVRIGVQLDLRGLVHLHVVKLRFLEIRFDPAFLVGHDADGGKAGDHHLTDLQSVRLADHTGHRRTNDCAAEIQRSEEHTSELQSLMRISYAVFCLKKKKNHTTL